MGPVNANEMFSCLLILLSSSFFNALVISELVMLVVDFLLESTENEEVIDEMHELMDLIELPEQQ